MVGTADLEPMAKQLDAHPDYRVLRRLEPREVYGELDPGESVYRGIYLDIETTGLDTTKAKVIELGMVPFDYSNDGRVLRVHHGSILSQFNDPGEPIPEEIVQLTGITNAMVAGQAIEPAAVEACARNTNLVIAHNAAFDRPIAERHWPVLAGKNWACSMTDVPWKDEGVGSAKLEYVAMALGFFFDGHRAVDDCLAGIEVLARELPLSGRPALSALLKNARATTVRIIAEGAPFEVKDTLKARGYRWNPGEDGHQKGWWTEVPEADLPGEMEWLGAEIFPNRDLATRPLPMETVTAKTRYEK
jgi:DNA polymerase III subunit epsilon